MKTKPLNAGWGRPRDLTKTTVDAVAAFLATAYGVSQDAIPQFSNRYSKKRFTQRQVLSLVLLREHLNLGFRTLTRFLAERPKLRAALGMRSAPSHPTFIRLRRRVGAPLLERLLDQVLAMLPEKVRVDLAHFRLTETQIPCMYYTTKSGDNVWTLHGISRGGLQRKNIITHKSQLFRLPVVNIPGR